METYIPSNESHVPRRSLRDKLRSSGHHLDEISSNPGQRMPYSGFMFPSEAVDCPPYSNDQLIHRDVMLPQLSARVSPLNQQHVVSEDASSKLCGDAHNFDSLRRPSSHYSTSWVAHSSGGSTDETDRNLTFVREVLSANLKASKTIPGPAYYFSNSDSMNRFQDLSSEISSQDSLKRHKNADGFPSKLYHHTLHEVVSSADGASELNAGNKLGVLPAYGRQINALSCRNRVAWNNNAGEFSCHQGIGDTSAQGLSLTLSSNPSSSVLMIRDEQDPSLFSSDITNPVEKPSIIGKKPGKALHEIMGVSTYSSQWRTTGPLGPFTGYSTILKSSQFLKPAQDLLDDLCRVTSPKPIEIRVLLEKISIESYMNCSNGGVSCSSTNVHPEDQQKRAALLFMQDEVCRRYNQYHQQMQLIVSSFETVAGLSATTPYISLALKTIVRNFCCLKDAISNQLQNVKSMQDDFSSSDHGATNNKWDLNSSRLTLLNQSFTKTRPFGVNMGFNDGKYHVWRPQRGLPEQSVAVLKAWLFEHFLHPYPTDTDKQILATQTGLSRNQVSNWFINARVRLWKPMVEEIHALETRRLAEGNPNSALNGQTSSIDQVPSQQKEAMYPQRSNSCRVNQQMASVAADDGFSRDGLSVQQWNKDLCSQRDGQLPIHSNGPLTGFMRYPQGAMEFAGMGAVSLSLGLRHNAQQRQINEQHGQQFGDERMHEFVD
ncbi:hypothetical protein SAY87_016626 [Trapa incisa]|uniref:Homeobox domain-containing protein n=1 Tax=Trapa incisa TaxID=236973 RepID=A0AAN7LFT8_9MYRT|nr:hypothetical protein SAY87_016626 [Trapa incisa]